jgi:hypothetical protein
MMFRVSDDDVKVWATLVVIVLLVFAWVVTR